MRPMIGVGPPLVTCTSVTAAGYGEQGTGDGLDANCRVGRHVSDHWKGCARGRPAAAVLGRVARRPAPGHGTEGSATQVGHRVAATPPAPRAGSPAVATTLMVPTVVASPDRVMSPLAAAKSIGPTATVVAPGAVPVSSVTLTDRNPGGVLSLAGVGTLCGHPAIREHAATAIAAHEYLVACDIGLLP